MEPLKYTREDIKKQIQDMRESINHTIDTMDRVFDIAFELDWNATMFKVDLKDKIPTKKNTTRKKKKNAVSEPSSEATSN